MDAQYSSFIPIRCPAKCPPRVFIKIQRKNTLFLRFKAACERILFARSTLGADLIYYMLPKVTDCIDPVADVFNSSVAALVYGSICTFQIVTPTVRTAN